MSGPPRREGEREGRGFNQRDVDLPVGRKEKEGGNDAMVEMARVAMMDRYIDGRGRTRTGREGDD